MFWGVQAGLLASAQTPPPALALGFKKEPKRKKIPEKEYASAGESSKASPLGLLAQYYLAVALFTATVICR